MSRVALLLRTYNMRYRFTLTVSIPFPSIVRRVKQRHDMGPADAPSVCETDFLFDHLWVIGPFLHSMLSNSSRTDLNYIETRQIATIRLAILTFFYTLYVVANSFI